LIETLHRTGQRLEELTAGEVDAVTNPDGQTFLLQGAQEQLRHSEVAKQAAILNSLPANIALLDTRGVIVSVNDGWRQFAQANALQSPNFGLGLDYLRICNAVQSEDSGEFRQITEGIRLVLAGKSSHFSFEYACHSLTERRWFLMTAAPLAGTPPKGAVVMHVNITDQKNSESRITYLNRVYAMLSGINTLIVRANDQDNLFKEACRIAVDAGGFHMSLIAIVDRKTTAIVPVASAGKNEELLSAIKAILSSGESGKNTLVAEAIREKKAIISNNSRDDPRLSFGKKYAEAGVRSLAIFPLIVSNEAVGVFTLYASEAEFFQEEESKLLSELAGDIAFAIDHIDKQDRLHYLAYYDVLTGLPNRTLLYDRLEQGLKTARRNESLLAVIFVDLDNFKIVNDTLGHTVGDALLREVSNRIASCLRDTDTVGRLGGDEFGIILPGIVSLEDAAMVAKKLIESCALSHLIEGHELFVSASLGITIFPEDADESEILVRNADTAMYRAKDSGGNTYQFFTEEMNGNTRDKLSLQADLRHALGRGEFLLHYQPKVSCATGMITGFEALLRWKHPLRGLVGPVAFIPILEETGLIVPVGDWLLTEACVQAQRWHDEGLGAPSMAVNISGRQIHSDDLYETVRRALDSSGLEPARLELELTESQLMKDAEGIIDLLRRLKAMGVKLSVDDFGTGFSSLAYLKRFPIDCLKVDQAFVKDIIADTNDVSITRAIITLAHNLKLKVVAEGVETEGQLGLLIANHCDEIQGYYFSRPLPAEEATALLQSGRSLDSRIISGMTKNRTLLLVDDEASVLSALRRLLRKDGYTILTASGAEQGLELLAIHPVDVIVSDQRMPGMSGIEFLRKVKILHPKTVRLVLSGYTDLQSVTDAVNEGAIYKFLTKPWDDVALRANIKEAFRTKDVADENSRAGSPTLFDDTRAIKDVVDAIPVAIFVKDSTSRFLLMNTACELQWGLSHSELYGTNGSQFFPPEQMAMLLAKDSEIFERAALLDFEETVWNAELKQDRFVHTFKKPIFDTAGHPLYLVCVAVDMTDRRLAAEKLLLSEEKLRTMFDMSPLGIAINSMEGVFIEANASFLKIVGYTLEELNRLSYWDLTPASYADQEAQQLESLKTTGRYGPYEKEYINNRNRHVPVRLNGVLITGSDGEKYIWSIVENISEFRRLES